MSGFGFSTSDSDRDELYKMAGKLDYDTVLVFDDLERLDAGLLIEILGYINQIVEHNNIKVIILANEKEIGENHKNDISTYKRYIEKVVRHKLHFTVDFATIGNQIIKKFSSNDGYANSILSAFNKADNTNLRTLQFAASMSHNILTDINKLTFLSTEEKNQIANLALYFFTSSAIDFKANRMTYLDLKKLSSWSAEKPVDISRIDFGSIQFDDKVIDGNKEVDSQKEYFDRYYAPSQMMYFDSLIEYLNSGYWDEAKFANEARAVADYNKNKGESESYIALNKLYNLLWLANDEIKEVILDVLKHVQNGDYQIEKYLNIYQAIESHIRNKLVKYSIKQLKKDIQGGIKKCKDSTYTYYITDYVRLPPDPDLTVKSIYDLVLERNQEIKSAEFSKKTSEHLKMIFDDPDQYNRDFLSSGDKLVPCFYFSCKPKEFLNRYVSLSNYKKNAFNSVFYIRENNSVSMDKAEMQWLRDLSKKIEKQMKAEKPSISRMNMHQLLIRTNKILENWGPREMHLD